MKPDSTARPIKTGNGRSPGFTLIELMIVLSIMGILFAIAIPMYGSSVTRAKEAALKEDLYQMRDALDKHYADLGEYPASLQALAEKKYVRSIPADPFTGSKDTWVEVHPDDLAEDSQGVYDVKSGSDLTDRNGAPYNEW